MLQSLCFFMLLLQSANLHCFMLSCGLRFRPTHLLSAEFLGQRHSFIRLPHLLSSLRLAGLRPTGSARFHSIACLRKIQCACVQTTPWTVTLRRTYRILELQLQVRRTAIPLSDSSFSFCYRISAILIFASGVCLVVLEIQRQSRTLSFAKNWN